jgi:predicted Zn-dependent peptidase
MSLAIVGDVDPDAAMGQVRAWFADVPRADVRPDGSPGAAAGPAAAGTPPVSPATTTAWAPADVDRPRLHLAWNTVALDGVDRPALDLVAALVEDALAAEADVAVRAWSGSRGGTFTIAADAPRSPRALLRRIDRVLEALTTEGPADGDLTRVRARLRAADLHAVETFAGRAEVLDLCLARTGEPDCLGSDEAARAALTTMDIQAVVRRWLPMARRTILVVMPASRGRALLPHAVRVDLG